MGPEDLFGLNNSLRLAQKYDTLSANHDLLKIANEALKGIEILDEIFQMLENQLDEPRKTAYIV